jgi:single-strand DNA-binding protein
MNKVIFSGNLGLEPEIKQLGNNNRVAKFNLAVNEKYKDAQGNTIENTVWITCEAWNKLADVCEKYLVKGSRVLVEGKFNVEKWDDEAGNKKIKYVVKVSYLEMTGSKPESHEDESV